MCVVLPTSIKVCETKVEVSHAHDILCYYRLLAFILHNVFFLNILFNVGAVNCLNAILVIIVLSNNQSDIQHKRQ
jgi:hypothetical protein